MTAAKEWPTPAPKALPIRIKEALERISSCWVALDPEMNRRFIIGRPEDAIKPGAPRRVTFAVRSGATKVARVGMLQGQGALALREVQVSAFLWGKNAQDAEDMLMCLAAVGAAELGTVYFQVLSEDWTQGDPSIAGTKNGELVVVDFVVGLALMRLPEEHARVSQIPIKPQLEPLQ